MSQSSRHAERGSEGVNLGLIITPMLDMSFQILAFFIMTYHPSAMEGYVNGNLVPPSRVKVICIDPKATDDLLPPGEPDLTETVQVIVHSMPRGGLERARGDGQPAQIFVKSSEDVDSTLVSDTDEPLSDSLKKLKTRLRSLHRGRAASNLRLDCQPDLKHRYVMEIYDVCRASGFENVSFVAPTPTKN